MTSNTIDNDMTRSGSGVTLLVNRYRVVKQLGQGGMGSVWLAEDTQLDNKKFAVKMLPSILVSNKRAYNQLKAEALVAMKLSHPNIVTLRAFEENDGNPFLVMDYIDGRTLDDYLAEWETGNGSRDSVARRSSPVARESGNWERGMGNGRDARPARPLGGLPEDEVVRLLKPIAEALDYAHGEGVVHRDVKPANVMIRKDGHPFILDFGIAREIQETMTRVTGKFSSGTLLYMSPEQLRGQSPKPAQDVYSFAAMAYECLKGEPPFARGQVEYQILNEMPERLPRGLCSFADAVFAALSKKPEDRPGSCVQVLATGLAAGKGNGKAPAKGRAFWWLGAAALCAVAAGVAFALKHVESPADKASDGSGEIASGPVEDAPSVVGREGKSEEVANAAEGSAPSEATSRQDVADAPAGEPAKAEPANSVVEVAVRSKPQPDATNAADVARAEPVEIPVAPVVAPLVVAPPVRVDEKFVSATNSLAKLVALRANVHVSVEEDIAAIRERPRGFTADLKRLDESWSNRWDGSAATLKEAESASDRVKKEIRSLWGATNMLAKVKARDSAVELENKVSLQFGSYKNEAVLYGLVAQNQKWKDAESLFSESKKKIDGGRFGEAANGLSVADRDFAAIWSAAMAKHKANQEAARSKEKETKLLSELAVRGFVMDNDGKEFRPGQEKVVDLGGGSLLELVWCPPGCFMMGSPEDEEDRNWGETRHAVCLKKGFWIGKYEITQSQWNAVMRDGSAGRKPKIGVSWRDCKEFVRKLNAMPIGKLRVRLPTEAEWEYACRAGQLTPFSFGSGNDGEFLNGTQAACAGKNTYPMRRKTLLGGSNSWSAKEVGSYRAFANDWGINDMHGNVYEWCEDVYAPYPTSGGISYDPVSTKGFSGNARVIRGGCWNHAAKLCRSAFRTSKAEGDKDQLTGFRVVCYDLP